MSATGLSPQSSSSSKLFNNKPFHHRNSSAELDVFEAANYFSGYYNEVPSHYTITNNNKVIARGAPAGRRMSLDSGMIHTHQIIIKDSNINNVGSSTNVKQHKQPSSPGARLASFLNQLFHQSGTAGSGLKKNKTKKSKSSAKDEDHDINANGGGRRKRRNSISNITRSWYYSTSTGTSTGTSTCTSSSSAHLPPQPAANYSLPTKSNKGFNQKAVSPLPIKSNGGLVDEKVANYKGARSLDNGCGHGDGYESDSSSDLFELQNYDSDVYSNGGLPVYDTTDVVSRVSSSTIS